MPPGALPGGVGFLVVALVLSFNKMTTHILLDNCHAEKSGRLTSDKKQAPEPWGLPPVLHGAGTLHG